MSAWLEGLPHDQHVAIPVSGVPVGLSLMNSGAADGSITITDVRTYGVDTVSLFEEALAWAEESKRFPRGAASRALFLLPGAAGLGILFYAADLGGALVQCDVSGVVDHRHPDDRTCLAAIRRQ